MFKNPCAHRKLFLGISIVLIVVSVLSMAFRGFNLGIDFTGGTTLEIEHMPAGFVYDGALEEDIENIILAANPEASTQIQKLSTTGGNEGVFVKTTELTDEQLAVVVDSIVNYFNGVETEAATGASDVATEIVTEVVTEVVTEAVVTEEPSEAVTETEIATETTTDVAVEEEPAAFGPGSIGIDKVNGTTSKQLVANTFKAVIFAIALMLVYISIRFDFKSGVSAVMALAHDVILMFGFYSLFQFTMNTSFVAAVLTIIGYSINATIVVFDRVRENNKMMLKASYDEKANKAIVTSYTRTLYSSLTTLFTIGALFVLGVSSIQEFALPIIVGIVCGAYSSLFVAPTFWALWKTSSDK